MIKTKCNHTGKLSGLFAALGRAACLTENEKKKLENNLAAEIIAFTAFASGCRDPERIVLAHLTTLIAAARCPGIFGHRTGESFADRLLAGNHYPGGDPEKIKAGMLLLELASLKDHRADFCRDLLAGKYNPLVDYHFERELDRLIREFNCLSAGTKQTFHELFDKTIKADYWYG